ncbi:MAG: LUD domain-containing protein [Planctomycetaceae bacterium]|nr:LUD domain-containing protein [Planctomycetaceae bacterium]
MATSRDAVLKAVRAQALPQRDLPQFEEAWITYPDRASQFAAVLQSVGGRCEAVRSRAEVALKLESHPAFGSAKTIVSLMPDAVPGNVDLSTIDDPHQLERVDFAIMPGRIAVAENGAVWVTDEGVKHRALYFITQHLVLIVSADALVDNLHQAYEQLTFGERRYGAFLSGPSKTADIEQSLVIGAHGPRSLTVYLVSA